MQFETKVISIEEQIACLERVIESYRGIIRVFDEDRMPEARDEMAKDILELMAARESLRHVPSDVTTAVHHRRCSITVPARTVPARPEGGLSRADLDRYLQNSATMRALREISHYRSAGQSIKIQIPLEVPKHDEKAL